MVGSLDAVDAASDQMDEGISPFEFFGPIIQSSRIPADMAPRAYDLRGMSRYDHNRVSTGNKMARERDT